MSKGKERERIRQLVLISAMEFSLKTKRPFSVEEILASIDEAISNVSAGVYLRRSGLYHKTKRSSGMCEAMWRHNMHRDVYGISSVDKDI